MAKPTSSFTTDDWDRLWTENKTWWQTSKPHPNLVRFFDSHVRSKLDGDIHVLVLLCGASVDMKWLLDQGCRVTGVEYSRKAIEQFLDEHSIEHTVQENWKNDLNLYTATKEKMHIVQGDFYKLKSTSFSFPFTPNAIWDRGSMAAINSDDHFKYRDTILSLVADGPLVSLMNLMVYDVTKYSGPPRSVTESRLNEVYGKWFDVEQIASYDDVRECKKKLWGLDELLEQVYVLTKR